MPRLGLRPAAPVGSRGLVYSLRAAISPCFDTPSQVPRNSSRGLRSRPPKIFWYGGSHQLAGAVGRAKFSYNNVRVTDTEARGLVKADHSIVDENKRIVWVFCVD